MPQNEHVRSIERFSARCTSVKESTTEDKVPFVEANILVSNGHRIHWRGPLTKGGLKKTFKSLLAMGASMEQDESGNVTNYLKGVGSKVFNVDFATVECEENEAPGSFRYYVKVVYD